MAVAALLRWLRRGRGGRIDRVGPATVYLDQAGANAPIWAGPTVPIPDVRRATGGIPRVRRAGVAGRVLRRVTVPAPRGSRS